MLIIPVSIHNLLIRICLSSYIGLISVHRLLRIIYITKPRLTQLSHIYVAHWNKRLSIKNQQSQRIIELSDIQLANDVIILNKNEDIRILWFDDNLEPEIKYQLIQMHEHIRICSTKKQLIDTVATILMYKIILIVSGQHSREALQLLHNNEKIDSIYIFCINNQLYEDLINSRQYRKLIGIYTEYQDLFNILEKQIRLLTKHLSIFTLFSHHNKSIRNLESESVRYLWYQLLRDTLMNMETYDSKQEMLDYCRTYYHNDCVMLKEIDEFEKKFQSTETIRDYSRSSPNKIQMKELQTVNSNKSEPRFQPSNAIQWYTNNSFPFKFINQALRTENIDALYKLRYFLIDICRNLKLIYDENFELYQDCFKPYLTVYRGFTLADSDIEQLKQSAGKYVSTNGFLSTSLSRQVAEAFATNVLFEIKISLKNKLNNHLIYAIIMEWSLIPNEEEVLFDMGALFQITDIKYETDKWIVSIVDIEYDKIDYLKNDYISTQRYKMEDGYLAKLLFGKFLFLIGQFDKAIEFFENLLRQQQLVLDDLERYTIFAYLSDTYNSIKQYDLAIEYSIKYMDLEKKLFSPSFSQVFHLMSKADIYRAQKKFNDALKYYEEALDKFDKGKYLRTTAVFQK
jgi:tetratricopeptide (TPR) repeat protein